MKKIIILILLLTIISCYKTTSEVSIFSLEGNVSNIEDGTKLFLRDLVNGGDIDSAIVNNNTFRFNSKLPEKALFTMLYTRDRYQFTEVWLEDKPMNFNSENGNFMDAIVTGSETHDLFKEIDSTVYESNNDKKIKLNEQKFIEKKPNSLISAFILYPNICTWTQSEIKESFLLCSESVQNSSLGLKIKDYINLDKREKGEKFLDMEILNTKGKTERISNLTKDITLLQFWSSSCEVSRLNNRQLSEIYKSYSESNFEIISISNDYSKSEWLQAIEDDNINWPQLSNSKGKNEDYFLANGIKCTPYNLLIDNDGLIIEQNIELVDLEEYLKTRSK